MASALTYPGVYIEEIASGVHTITGVATSITSFVGRAPRGPINQAVTLNSMADFQRVFGGLWVAGTLGFSVQDFFANGGTQAIVVRLYHADPGSPNADPPVAAPGTTAMLTVGAMLFSAVSPGKWGNGLRVAIDTTGVSADVAASLGVGTAGPRRQRERHRHPAHQAGDEGWIRDDQTPEPSEPTFTEPAG